MTRERFGHVPALDGVRGIAIAAVVGFHFFDTPSGGGIGVDLFFVLSGFLITTLLLEEQSTTGRISLVEFYKRRGRRLLPGLGALLAAAAAVLLTGGSSVVSPRSLIGGAFYVTNIIDAFHPIHGALQHLWTLAEEEQFYLLWPIVLLWLLRRRVSPMRLARGLAKVVRSAKGTTSSPSAPS